MKLIQTIGKMRAFRAHLSHVALIPTMGNLHVGHLALVAAAKLRADYIVVSIFVNPLQFGVNEDFGSYPRTLAEDCQKLEALGVDVVFVPNVTEMYPTGEQAVRVTPSDIQNELCGASRTGHFTGVATVVTKLFNIVQPNFAYFGEKDFQQLYIIREIVEALNMPVEIVSIPIYREASGLALSSRNGYLSVAEKEKAVALSQSLVSIRAQMLANEGSDLRAMETQAINALSEQGWQVDYLSIRDQHSLKIAQRCEGELVILTAATIGRTRLIDNLVVKLPSAC